MRVVRWSNDTNKDVYFEVWHDSSQFEAQRSTPYRVSYDSDGNYRCSGCQSKSCVHVQAVRES
jgi:hypothetical protein